VAAAEPDALQVDVDRPAPDVEGRVLGAQVVGMHDPGVVVADVETSEALGGLVEQPTHGVVVGDVTPEERGIAAGLCGERDRLLPACLVDIVHRDPPALASEEDRRGTSEAAARARDEADLAVEEAHGGAYPRWLFGNCGVVEGL
jgi:hypothetical protein